MFPNSPISPNFLPPNRRHDQLQEKIKEKQLSKFCSVVRKIDGIDLSNSSFEVDFFIASSDAEGIGGTLAKLAFGELFKDIFKSLLYEHINAF